MTRASPLLLAAVLALWPVVATPQSGSDLEDAGSVVMQQLDAFRRDDFDEAFTFASTEIHQLFDRARFEQMVRSGYPEIARSTSAVIDGVQRVDPARLYLFARVRGANGRAIEAVYEMVLEDGRWRINAVVTRPDSSEKASLSRPRALAAFAAVAALRAPDPHVDLVPVELVGDLLLVLEGAFHRLPVVTACF